MRIFQQSKPVYLDKNSYTLERAAQQCRRSAENALTGCG